MNQQQIDYVLALAEEKSFSKAASKLFVTQPALSQFIKNIEVQVGMPLFDRSTSPISLTPAGEAYIEAAKRIQNEKRDLENKIADLSDLKTGRIALGTSFFRASCMLPTSIREFQKKYPGVDIEIITDNVLHLKEFLLNGDIDFCIETGHFDESHFHSEVLFGETYYLAAPRDHSFNDSHKEEQIDVQDILDDSEEVYTKKRISVSECKDLPFIFLNKGDNLYLALHALCVKAGFEPKVKMRATQIEMAFHWTNADIAFTFVPDTLIRFGNHTTHPIYYRLDTEIASQDIVVAMKKNRYITQAMKEYIADLRHLIGFGTWN